MRTLAFAWMVLALGCLQPERGSTKEKKGAKGEGDEADAALQASSTPGLGKICDHSRGLASAGHLAIEDRQWAQMRPQCVQQLKKERDRWKGAQSWDDYVACVMKAETLEASAACDQRTAEDKGRAAPEPAPTAGQTAPVDPGQLRTACEHAFGIAAREGEAKGKAPLPADKFENLVKACMADLSRQRKTMTAQEWTAHMECIAGADTAMAVATCGKAAREKAKANAATPTAGTTPPNRPRPSAPSNVCRHTFDIMLAAMGPQPMDAEVRKTGETRCTEEMTEIESKAGPDRWRELATCYLAAKNPQGVQLCERKKMKLREAVGMPKPPPSKKVAEDATVKP